MNYRKLKGITFAVTGALFAACLAAVLILAAVTAGIARALPAENAARRWGEGNAQISVFFPADASYTTGNVPSLTRQIDEAMTEASLTAPVGARLWLHAYSTEITASVSTDRGSVNATATVCGGDYFQIHDPVFVSGTAVTETAAGDGAIVLDERAAFALFGAVNVTGSTVFINEQPYTVAGVTAVPESRFYDGYGEGARIFVLYSSPLGRSVSRISAWSAVLPEPIDGFAANLTEELFAGHDTAVTVENSARFTAASLLQMTKERETLGIRTSAITFPYWENEARVAAYRASVCLTAQIVLAVPMGLILLLWIALLWKPTEKLLARGRDTVKDKAETAWERVTIPETRKQKPKKEKKEKPPKVKKEKAAKPKSGKASPESAEIQEEIPHSSPVE